MNGETVQQTRNGTSTCSRSSAARSFGDGCIRRSESVFAYVSLRFCLFSRPVQFCRVRQQRTVLLRMYNSRNQLYLLRIKSSLCGTQISLILWKPIWAILKWTSQWHLSYVNNQILGLAWLWCGQWCCHVILIGGATSGNCSQWAKFPIASCVNWPIYSMENLNRGEYHQNLH